MLVEPGQFVLPACAEVMSAVGRKLRQGIGLVVLDRVPVERFNPRGEHRRVLAARVHARAPGRVKAGRAP